MDHFGDYGWFFVLNYSVPNSPFAKTYFHDAESTYRTITYMVTIVIDHILLLRKHVTHYKSKFKSNVACQIN
jgi:hypothetical protein